MSKTQTDAKVPSIDIGINGKDRDAIAKNHAARRPCGRRADSRFTDTADASA
jgi:hypothetical protein